MDLRARFCKEFGEKVYPNPKDPEIAKAITEGRMEFEEKYLGKSYPWILGGEVLTNDREYMTVFPCNRDIVVGRFPVFSADALNNTHVFMHLLRRVRAAGLQFFETVSWKKRVELLIEISNVVRERFWLLVAAKQYETGQSIMEAIGETDEEVDFPLATAMYLQDLHSETLLPSPKFSGHYNGKSHVPHGVFLDISPFNFPGAIPMDMACKALAMGNAVIEKSSNKSSLCGYLVYESIKIAFERLGISYEGVLNYTPGGPEVVDLLLESPDISGVSFTGSSAALTEIKKKHGTALRNTYAGKAPLTFGSAETSGVNPVVVWKDADLEHAAKECVKSFIGRQGQKCSSARIIMVHEEVADVFLKLLETVLYEMRYGNVLEGADFGEIITPQAGDVIYEKIKILIEKKVVDSHYSYRSSTRILHEGSTPTILYAVEDVWKDEKKARELMNTEIFGPVTTVVVVPDLDVVRYLRGLSEFALTGSYFAEDVDVCIELNEILKSGNLYQNRKCTGALVETECFGGLRSRSGDGVKDKAALALFSSIQTHSGFYGSSWTDEQKKRFVERMRDERGVVFTRC